MKRPLPNEAIERITKHFDIREEWLLDGEGEMLNTTAEERPSGAVINFEKGVPYYDESFELGFHELAAPFSQNPAFLVNMPKYGNATLWCNVTGDSMEPEISSGDVVALRLIGDPTFLIMGEVYAIETTNGLRTIKRVRRGSDPQHYTLVPANPEYDPQEIPVAKILRVFKVLGSLHAF